MDLAWRRMAILVVVCFVRVYRPSSRNPVDERIGVFATVDCAPCPCALPAAFLEPGGALSISAGDKAEPSSARSVLFPSLLTCLHDFVHVPRWPNLENVAMRQRRMLADELYSMIHVPCLKDEKPPSCSLVSA
jgi:hypothetical protein